MSRVVVIGQHPGDPLSLAMPSRASVLSMLA
jgi:hypothetical protein